MRDINIAVIGVGYIGYHHARILHSLKDINLVAVVDTNIQRAQEVAKEFGCSASSDYLDIMKDVDCCCIATSTESHYRIAVDFINNAKHVFIEKPITSNSDEAASLISLSQEKNVSIQVGHIERFNPVFQKSLTSDKKPTMFCSERLSPFLKRASGIDVTKDLLIHDIDLILTCLRSKAMDTNVKKINAYGICLITDKPDLVISDIEFACGITAHIKASRVEKDRKRMMTVYHHDGYETMDFQSQLYISFQKGNMTFDEIVLESQDDLLTQELKSFVSTLTNNTPIKVTAVEAMEALKIAEDINKVLGDNVL